MPIVQWERHISRPANVAVGGMSLERHWFVGGTMDENDVYLTALAATPQVFDNLIRSGIQLDPQGGGNWNVTISYKNIALQQGLPTNGAPGGGGTTPQQQGPPNSDAFLGPNISFDTTGGTEHFKQSFRTLEKKSAAGFTANDKTRAQAQADGFMLDNQRAIGASADGVRGVDRFVSTFRFSVEVKRDTVSMAYLSALEDLTYKTNNATFWTRAQGELLYKGAAGRWTDNRWDINHTFEARRNKTSVNVGNGITLELVRGWELIEVEYMPKAVNGRTLNVPKSAYVEEIYEPGDFTLLEIGA